MTHDLIFSFESKCYFMTFSLFRLFAMYVYRDHYVTSAGWIKNREVCIIWTSRPYNLSIISVCPKTNSGIICDEVQRRAFLLLSFLLFACFQSCLFSRQSAQYSKNILYTACHCIFYILSSFATSLFRLSPFGSV